MTETVRIFEVGPRDGLQNEAQVIPVARKMALIDALAKAGLQEIEIGSFVSPKWVPQMADTDQVMAGVGFMEGVRLTVLVPNMKGWQGFAAARVPGGRYQVAVFISASEGFSQSNLNCSVAQAVERAAPVVAAARAAGVDVRGYVSCVTDCPFDGPVAPAAVAEAVGMLLTLAPMQVSLGDTIGKATPETTAAMLDAVTAVVPAADLAGHFHDTGGQALASVDVALRYGLRAFDGAVGGLGGCPYAPGAPGNLATEALVAHLHAQGYETGVDLDALEMATGMAKDMR
ncbi:MAG: hydroxymethylglutaryl-CoA lyase [Pseudomonadota bacterium]